MNEPTNTQPPPAEPKRQSWWITGLEALNWITPLHALGKDLQHLGRIWTFFVDGDDPGTGSAAKILKKARIESWGAETFRGNFQITVALRHAQRAGNVLAKAGIAVLNPYTPAPQLLPTTRLLAGLTGQQHRSPRAQARQAHGKARRPGGLLDRFGL